MSKKIYIGWKVFSSILNELRPVASLKPPTNHTHMSGYHPTEWNIISNKKSWGPVTVFTTEKDAIDFGNLYLLHPIIKKVEYIKSKRKYLHCGPGNNTKYYIGDVLKDNIDSIPDPSKVDLAEGFRIIE
ncbi:hypothetical protein M0R19_08785 [Candidatus Pacearchaeota archaeon]|jgi:hypothetical protein|nr:hypothetical protein [Candidatus Pacearchaeota archaeon]